ncbi:USP6 N-terminal-like protein [Vulpes lagopus]
MDRELPGLSPRKAKKLCQETQRTDKWIKMLKRRDHYLPSEKLWCRVYRGVPPQVQGQVWLRLLKVDQVKARNARKYQEMKEAALVSSRDIMQIDLDVNRTFRSHTMFWDRYGVGLTCSEPCSTCWLYDTEVGYCQGMSEIAAILLMFLPEQDAFWALAQLMTDDRHAMHGFFVPGFPKLLRFQAHHERVLQRALPDLRKHMDEEQMSTGICIPKWFLQCFLGRLWDAYILDGERVLTAMAYTTVNVHRKRLLKLPLEGLREFLQDSLAQLWALEDEAVLRHLRASMTQLRRMRCHLPPPQVGPEEFPTRPLGLERVSPEPGPLLPSPASETPPRVEELASPGPATQPEPPGPPPVQDGAGRRPPDMVDFKTKNGVPFHLAPAWATPEALRRTRPWSPPHPGTSITGSLQPPRDDAVEPKTPFLSRGHCNWCPSLGSDGHSQGRARAALSLLPRGPTQAQDPLPSMSTGQLDARRPRGQSLVVSVGARRLWPAITMLCLMLLSLPEGGTPRTGHQPLTLRDLGWPGPGLCGVRGDLSSPRPSTGPGALARPAFWPRAE